MAKIPAQTDPTLEAVDKALEVAGNVDEPRAYLGMSGIGAECPRQLWYDFRWALKTQHAAATLKKFEDGDYGELVMTLRLMKVKGVTLKTRNADGVQFEYSDIGGHFKGHLDGVISGLLQAPKTTHVWEHKQVSEKRFKALQKCKEEYGEKQALENWNLVYYAQAMVYCHYAGLERHYLTVSTPGGRETISVRTNANDDYAVKLIKTARKIIESAVPPIGLSQDGDHYLCKMCRYGEVCFGKKLPQVHCRTCCHVTPITEEPEDFSEAKGRWTCNRHGIDDIPIYGQREGCDDHLYIPALLCNLGNPCGANPEENWIRYETATGERFKNTSKAEQKVAGEYSSNEIRAAADAAILTDPNVGKIRETFNGEISSEQ